MEIREIPGNIGKNYCMSLGQQFFSYKTINARQSLVCSLPSIAESPPENSNKKTRLLIANVPKSAAP